MVSLLSVASLTPRQPRRPGPGAGVLALVLCACGPSSAMDGDGDGATASTDEPTASATADSADPPPATSGVPGLCESGDDGWVTATSGGGGGEGTGGAEETGFGMGDDMPLVTDLYDINQSGIPTGERVEVRDVVVVSPVSDSETGWWVFELFVQEQGSGPYSGIRVRGNFFLTDPPLPGDRVTVIGQVRGQHSHRAIQVDIQHGGRIDITGTAPIPAPIVLSTEDLEDPNADTALAYEGAVVRVESVTVTRQDACDGEFDVDAVLRVDDRYLQEALPSPEAGDRFASLTGPLIYVLDGANEGLELAPRDGDDVQP